VVVAARHDVNFSNHNSRTSQTDRQRGYRAYINARENVKTRRKYLQGIYLGKYQF